MVFTKSALDFVLQSCVMKHCILVSHCLYLTAVEREAPRADHPIDQVKGTMCNSVCFYMTGVLTLSQQNGVFYWISVWVITQKIRNKVNARQLCVPSLGVPSPEDEGSSGSRSPTWKIGLIVDDWSCYNFFQYTRKSIIKCVPQTATGIHHPDGPVLGSPQYIQASFLLGG